MDYASNGQVRHHAYADSSLACQQQHDYYYQQYQSHPSYHQSASSSSYYHPSEYNFGAVDSQTAASYAQQQPHVDAALQPPGMDISNLAQAAAAAASNQRNGYFPHAITQQPGHPFPSLSHLIPSPAEPRNVVPVGLWETRGGEVGLARGDFHDSVTTTGRCSSDMGGGLLFRGGAAGVRRGGGSLSRGRVRVNFDRHVPRSDNVLPAHARGGGRTVKGIARRPASATPPHLLKCAVCKIECNSLEILEQHRQGKKHKKKLQRLEEDQKRRKLGSVSETKAPNETEVTVENQQNEVPDSKNLSNLKPNVETKMEVDQQEENRYQQTTGAEQTALVDVHQHPIHHEDLHLRVRGGHAGRGQGRGRGRLGSHQDRRTGPNKRLQGRPQFDPQNGKRARVSNASLLPVNSGPLPKVCTLCNINCDSQAVLDCHLAGKKHATNLKRLQSQQQLYDPQVLQASQAHQAISTLAQQQGIFNPQNQQAVLESLLSQAIQQVLAGQAVATQQVQSALPTAAAMLVAAAMPAAAAVLQVQEHGEAREGSEAAASESKEGEPEGGEEEQNDDTREEGGEEEQNDNAHEEDGEEEQNDNVEEKEVGEQWGDAREEGDEGVKGDVEPEQVGGAPEGNIKEDEGDEQHQDCVGAPTESVLPIAQNASVAAEDSTPALEFAAAAAVAETVVPYLDIQRE